MGRIMQLFFKNNHDWNNDLKSGSISYFNSTFRYIKFIKIIVFLIFLFLIGTTFFLILLIHPHKSGFLVPIIIINYEDK